MRRLINNILLGGVPVSTLLLGFAQTAIAGTAPTVVCVTSTAEFQTALANAASSLGDTTIEVAAGTYPIDSVLSYVTFDEKALTIEGGFKPLMDQPCGDHVADASLSILDGGGTSPILDLSNFLVAANMGAIKVRHLTFQHSLGAALHANTYGSATQVDIDSNVFVDNSSPADGGGVLFAGAVGVVRVANNLFAGNTSGGITVFLTAAVASGTPPHSGIFTNNTVTSNTTGANYASVFINTPVGATFSLSNNIVWGNFGGDDLRLTLPGSIDSGPSTLANNDIGTFSGINFTETDDVNVDPRFVGGGSYALASDSPLIDAGTNAAPGGTGTYDLAGLARIVAIRSDTPVVDIGAYELQDLIFKDGYD
ncbi:MAG: choice-of-anchor Q domain-containing protein [Dokdonella sp.]